MSKLDELMALVGRYGVQANIDTVVEYPSQLTQEARTALQDALKAVVEDAERYRSMQLWDGKPHAVTDTVWIEPGRVA